MEYLHADGHLAGFTIARRGVDTDKMKKIAN